MIPLRQRIHPIPPPRERVIQARSVVQHIQTQIVYHFFVVVFVIIPHHRRTATQTTNRTAVGVVGVGLEK